MIWISQVTQDTSIYTTTGSACLETLQILFCSLSLPRVAHHGARHGHSSSGFLIIAVRHLGSKVLERDKSQCLRKLVGTMN